MAHRAANEFIPPSAGGIGWLRPLLIKGGDLPLLPNAVGCSGASYPLGLSQPNTKFGTLKFEQVLYIAAKRRGCC